VAARTPRFVRSSVVQVPTVRVDRRERRLLRQPVEEERESDDNGRVTEIAWPRHSLEGEQIQDVIGDLS